MKFEDVLAAYPGVSFSEMASEDMIAVLVDASPETLASIKQCFGALNGMGGIKVITDMPRDGVNFNFQSKYIYGGMIRKGETYDLYS